jgi:hypothetical protein
MTMKKWFSRMVCGEFFISAEILGKSQLFQYLKKNTRDKGFHPPVIYTTSDLPYESEK